MRADLQPLLRRLQDNKSLPDGTVRYAHHVLAALSHVVPKAQPDGFRLAQAMMLAGLSRVATGGPDVEWFGSLKNYGHEILNCSIWKSLETRNNAVVLALSKALPQRCQIRETGDILLKKFGGVIDSDPAKCQPPDAGFETAFAGWFECSLLGLFEHSRFVLPVSRLLEYCEMTNTPARRQFFFRWLLKRQELRAIFAIRDYMMQILPYQPSVLQSIRKTFDWDNFASACGDASAKLADVIGQHGWAVLFAPWPFGPTPKPQG